MPNPTDLSVSSPAEVAEHYQDTEKALRYYFAGQVGEASGTDMLARRLRFHDLSCSLMLLAAIEAIFRVDYQVRVKNKLKDDLSRYFRDLEKRIQDEPRKDRAALELDIFDGWREHVPGSKELISQIKTAFKYRHWLAHGRYWTPKLGRHYDFLSLYDLTVVLFDTLDLQTA